MRFDWAVALAASALILPLAAEARETAQSISIPPGNLADALASLAVQTGISFGYDTPLPPIRVRGVTGRLSPREAIDRLLRDTPVKAVRMGPNAFRIVRRERREPRRDTTPVVLEPAAIAADIVVTGRKLPEILSRVPAPLAVYVPGGDKGAGANAGQREVARSIDGMVVAGRGDGSERMFLRGLADSPFDGFSQSTVSVQIDDGRVTYDAAEPGLRLVDVARVEVLKGPQGPLYGTGALGGVYRIVTNRPLLGDTSGSAALSFDSIAKGGPGASGEATLNLPIVRDMAAVRLVGYSATSSGWIDDVPISGDANRMTVTGARAALRIAPANGWSIDLTAARQRLAARDSQYVYRAGRDLERAAGLLEPAATGFDLLQARAEGPIGRLQLVIATSQAWQRRSDLYDLSQAPTVLGIPGATAWRDERSYRVFDQEIRLTSAPGDRFAWTTGLSYLAAATTARGSALVGSTQWTPSFSLQRRVTEAAMFADGSLPVAPRLSLAAGFRLFRSSVEDERREPAMPTASTRGLTGFTPNLSLSYDLGRTGIVYARIATAFRPGGIDPGNNVTGRYDADEVRSLDLGTRLSIDRGRLTVDAAFFLAQWRDMQSDYLESNGLLATHNAGDAAITGVEAKLAWRPDAAWNIETGLTLQRARLSRGPNGSDLPVDRRLPLTPDIALRFAVDRTIRLGRTSLKPFLAVNFTGSSRLSFDDGLDRPMSDYAVLRGGITASLASLSVRLDVDNALDARADTFAYGNPFTVRALRQFTPLRPRTITVTLSHDF